MPFVVQPTDKGVVEGNSVILKPSDKPAISFIFEVYLTSQFHLSHIYR